MRAFICTIKLFALKWGVQVVIFYQAIIIFLSLNVDFNLIQGVLWSKLNKLN
jgi:hypothetical protein